MELCLLFTGSSREELQKDLLQKWSDLSKVSELSIPWMGELPEFYTQCNNEVEGFPDGVEGPHKEEHPKQSTGRLNVRTLREERGRRRPPRSTNIVQPDHGPRPPEITNNKKFGLIQKCIKSRIDSYIKSNAPENEGAVDTSSGAADDDVINPAEFAQRASDDEKLESRDRDEL